MPAPVREDAIPEGGPSGAEDQGEGQRQGIHARIPENGRNQEMAEIYPTLSGGAPCSDAFHRRKGKEYMFL